MTNFTVLGASGFIGSHLAAAIRLRGHSVWTPGRTDDLADRPAGHVFYCIGVTSDFRTRPFETMTAHVTKLAEVLQTCSFQSLTYLSSTRVYHGHVEPVDEDTEIRARPCRPDDLYNISKLAGEALALHSGRPVRVARLSNVYGRVFQWESFLPSIIHSALTTGTIRLQSSPESVRDYINVDDVVELLLRIALEGKSRIYNVASGRAVANGEIAKRVAELTGATFCAPADVPTTIAPPILNTRIQTEFSFRPSAVLDDLPALIADYAKHLGAKTC